MVNKMETIDPVVKIIAHGRILNHNPQGQIFRVPSRPLNLQA